MSKIGQNVVAKQEEARAYETIGILQKVDKKYAVVRLKVSGMEVEQRTILKEVDNYAEALSEFQVHLGKFTMDFLNERLK